MQLLGSNTKIDKSNKNVIYQSYIMHLMPNNTFDGKHNLCPSATEGCKAACLHYSYFASNQNVKAARAAKTEMFINNNNVFMTKLFVEIEDKLRKAKNANKQLVIRLNGTSDIAFENIKVFDKANIFELFPEVIFYDYTKIAKRLNKKLPSNYTLIFSYSGEKDYYGNVDEISKEYMASGGRVAVVFKKKMPTEFLGYPVYNGTEDDLVFLKPASSIIGLKPVGLYGKKDTSGFMIEIP